METREFWQNLSHHASKTHPLTQLFAIVLKIPDPTQLFTPTFFSILSLKGILELSLQLFYKETKETLQQELFLVSNSPSSRGNAETSPPPQGAPERPGRLTVNLWQCEGLFSFDIASRQVDAIIFNTQTWTPRWWDQMEKEKQVDLNGYFIYTLQTLAPFPWFWSKTVEGKSFSFKSLSELVEGTPKQYLGQVMKQGCLNATLTSRCQGSTAAPLSTHET